MLGVEEEHQRQKWKAALVGALVSGILGPAIGAFLALARDAVRQSSFRGAADVFSVLPYLLPGAVVVMGPAGLIFGTAGSLILQALSVQVSSIKVLAVWGAGLGMMFGAAVPFSLQSFPCGQKAVLSKLSLSVSQLV